MSREGSHPSQVSPHTQTHTPTHTYRDTAKMPKKGGRRKKTRTHKESIPEGANVPEAVEENVPRSIVARITKVSPLVGDLVKDLRQLMGPYTASNLKEKRYNRTKDFVTIAGHLGVSHLLLVSQTESNILLRVARHPNGPTLHFRINQFMLPRHVKALQKRPFESHAAFQTPPVLVLNNFNQSDEQHVKLMKVTFQHMFPAINVKTVKLNDCRRVVLFHFNKDSQTVEMRHYAIRANPVGISRGVKKILQAKLPDLGQLHDISEFVDGTYGGAASDSEAEDESSRVTLPDRIAGRGNAKSQLSAMKLIELGPRMTMELYKVEQGVSEGDVLYHKFVSKTAEEAAATKARIERLKKLKEQRRKVQEENVKRKREEKEEKKKQKDERKRQRLENGEAAGAEDEESEEDEDDEEDEEYFDEDFDENDLDGDGAEGEDDAVSEDNQTGEEEEDDEDDEDDEEESDGDDEDDE